MIGKAVNLISACFVASKQSGGIRPNAIKAEPTVYTVNFYVEFFTVYWELTGDIVEQYAIQRILFTERKLLNIKNLSHFIKLLLR